MLSKTCKYALRAMIYLGKYGTGDNKVRIKEITKEIDVPAHFLAKILQNLAKDGVIGSTKGPSGGFFLHRPLNEITLLNVVEAVEGKEYLDFCLLKNEPCDCVNNGDTHCPVHERFSVVKVEVNAFYEQTTIQDIIVGMDEHSGLIAL